MSGRVAGELYDTSPPARTIRRSTGANFAESFCFVQHSRNWSSVCTSCNIVSQAPRRAPLPRSCLSYLSVWSIKIAVTADAAYDTVGSYDAGGARGATVVVPPHEHGQRVSTRTKVKRP